jgi:hypothetical protein
MSESNCVDPFQFVLLNYQYGLNSAFDGILGMAQGGNREEAPENWIPGKLFLNALSASGHITQEAFSFNLDSTTGDNFVDYGPPKLNTIKDPT